MSQLQEHFRFPWRTYVDHDCGAAIETIGGVLVLFVGYTPAQEPDLAVAEHICELHNAWLRDEAHPRGQLGLPEV